MRGLASPMHVHVKKKVVLQGRRLLVNTRPAGGRLHPPSVSFFLDSSKTMADVGAKLPLLYPHVFFDVIKSKFKIWSKFPKILYKEIEKRDVLVRLCFAISVINKTNILKPLNKQILIKIQTIKTQNDIRLSALQISLFDFGVFSISTHEI